MIKSITIIKGAEVTVCGCTFIVNYRYTPAIPATHWEPAEEVTVEVLRAEIKGQPEGYADELLEAIKINLRSCAFRKHVFDNGYDLLQQKLLEEHNK